jgi:hypothetical protein
MTERILFFHLEIFLLRISIVDINFLLAKFLKSFYLRRYCKYLDLNYRITYTQS